MRALDRRHPLELAETQLPGIGGPVGGPGSRQISATSSEVRIGSTGRCRLQGCLRLGQHAQPVERADHGLHVRVATMV